MHTFGKREVGQTILTIPLDQKRAYRVRSNRDSRIVKLQVYCDGLGSGSGDAKFRGQVHTTGGVLLGETIEVVVADNAPAGWVDAIFRTPVVVDVGVEYDIGLHVGGATNVLRLYADKTALGKLNTSDSYDDGDAPTFGSATADTYALSLYAATSDSYVAPDASDVYYARLPFAEAQAVLGRPGVLATRRYRADAVWHGTFTDEERGSFALVNIDGPLASLLGERVKVTAREGSASRSVFAFVHNDAELLGDISLTRQLFSRLSYPARTDISVLVEVVGPDE